MTRRFTRWGLRWGLCLLSLTFALEGQALTLENMLSALDQGYPPLQAARQKLAMAEGKLLQKRGVFDTKIKAKSTGIPLGYYEQIVLDGLVEQATPFAGLVFYGGYRLGAGNFAVYDGKKQTDGLGEIRTGFVLPLLKNSAIDQGRLEIAQAELDLEVARLGVLEKHLKFIKESSKVYWSWVAASRKRAVAQDLLDLVKKRNADLEQSVQAGQLPRIVLVENQTALFKRQAKLIGARQKEQQAAYELSLFLQRDANGQLQTPFSKIKLDFPALQKLDYTRLATHISQAQSHRPEPLALALQLEQNQLSQLWAENQNLPQLDLNFALSKDVGGGDKTRDPLELEAGLGFEWPLQLRKSQGVLQVLQAEKKQLEWELLFSREQIGVEVQNINTALVAAKEKRDLAGQQVSVARELESAERTRFDLGASTLLVLNLREQARGDAMNEEIEALEAWHKSWAEYLSALGLLQLSTLPIL
jgi:outer membrane protein, heavy metal efflux system